MTLTKLRNILIVVFIISTAVAVLLFLIGLNGIPAGDNDLPTPADDNNLILMLTLITSTASLFGVISTSILSWRKDQRETRAQEMDLASQRISLEREKLDLEKERLDFEKERDSDPDQAP